MGCVRWARGRRIGRPSPPTEESAPSSRCIADGPRIHWLGSTLHTARRHTRTLIVRDGERTRPELLICSSCSGWLDAAHYCRQTHRQAQQGVREGVSHVSHSTYAMPAPPFSNVQRTANHCVRSIGSSG